jgi:hypothetical protein
MIFSDLALKAPEAREALTNALVDALPSEELLTEALMERLGKPRAAGGALATIARSLVRDSAADSSARLLLRAARSLNPDSEALLEFEASRSRRCFDADRPGAAGDVRKLDRLIDILDTLGGEPTETVLRTFESVALEEAPQWATNREGIHGRVVRATLVSLLAEQDTRPFPLLRFVASLVANKAVTAEARKALDKWLSSVGKKLGIGVSTLRAPPPAPASDSYVMIRLCPTQMGGRFLSVAWLVNDDGTREVWRDECESLDAACQKLRAELDRRASALVRGLRGVSPTKITYEFILARADLEAAVDQWRIGLAGLPVGTIHRVVVRSYERIYEFADRAWSTKWSAWGDPTRAPPPLWYDPDLHRVDDGFRRNLVDEGAALLVFAGPPRSDAGDAIDESIRIGIPVAVWPRCIFPEARKVLEPLLNDGTDLRDAVRALRNATHDHEPGVRENLTLLWDDPTRVPPDTTDLQDVPGE